MQRTIFLKALIIIGLMTILCIPLAMIESTIAERKSYRDEAVRSITADSVAEQTILGPVLVQPYSDTYEEEGEIDPTTKRAKIRTVTVERRHYVYPNELNLVGAIATNQRYRGIHKVLVFISTQDIDGDFTLPDPAAFPKEKAGSRLALHKPFIAFGMSDPRGLRNFPKVDWNGKQYEFNQSSRLHSFRNGLHAPLEALPSTPGAAVKFKLQLVVEANEKLHIVPIAKNNKVNLSSNWPHPQYSGRFLPVSKQTRPDNGFSANWSISSLSSNAQQQLLANEVAGQPVAETGLDYFSVAIIEPINVYSQGSRAVKYGLLFVALTFAAFFLFELLKKLPIHPVQYTLVGLALALFFLMLVSLSERMEFMQAYLISSAACIGLIGFYLSFALRSWVRGMGFGVALTVLYGILFGVLQSENNALVMGTILLFAVLAAIMIVTRKVDWYALGKGDPVPVAAQ